MSNIRCIGMETKIFDPLREASISVGIWKPMRLVLMIIHPDTEPQFMVRQCIHFTATQVWQRYARMVASRYESRVEATAPIATMKQWLSGGS